MEIKTVGVLGCGLMGSGIAQVCAAAGYKTIVREVDDIALDKGIGRIRKFLDDGVAKGKVTAETRDTTLGNLSGTTTFDGLKDCDLIIEAIVENLEDKRQTYASLEKIVKDADDLRLEHLVALHHRARRGDDAAGSVRRPPFLQPGAAHEARRGDPRADDERRDLPDRVRLRRVAGQGADHRPRSPRLHRQPPARAVSARRHPRPTRTASARSRTSTRA